MATLQVSFQNLWWKWTWEHKGVKDMVHVDSMAERKQLLVKDVDAVIALPRRNRYPGRII